MSILQIENRLRGVFIGVALAVTIGAENAAAQVPCSVGYDRAQRVFVLAELDPIEERLERMAFLAEWSAGSGLSLNQRLALEQEFIALREWVQVAGMNPPQSFNARSALFFDDVVDSQYLGLTGLTLIGASIQEAQMNSRNALDRVQQGHLLLELCLAGSWERVPLKGTPNTGDCAGGYDRRDGILVRTLHRRAQRMLKRLRTTAYESAVGVFSAFERRLRQFEFEFDREDIELLGQVNLSGASTRTRNFVATVLDPTYLGIQNSTVSGPTIEESQRLAREALSHVVGAQRELRRCVYLP